MREPIFELGSVEGVESPSLILSHLDPEPSLPSLCHARWLIAEETQQSLEEEKSLETCSWSTVLAESLQKQRKLGEEYRARCRHLHLSEPASICSEASEPSNKLKRSRSGRSTNVFSSANDIGGALKASEPSSSSRALQQPCNNAVAYETALSSLLWLETVREDIPDFSAKGGVSLETLKSSPVLQRLQGVQEEIGRLDFFIQRVEAMRLLEEEQFLHHVQEIREQKKKVRSTIAHLKELLQS